GRVAAGIPATAENPGKQLPVATRPAMLACRRDVVARREFLDDLDVGDQPGARENALEEVVTQQRALGNASCERGLEDIDVIDSFAGVGSLTEEVLKHVGNGERVRIDPARTREDALED